MSGRVFSLSLTFLFVGVGQGTGGELRGVIVSPADLPVSDATIEARAENGKGTTQYATTMSDGSYRLTGLSPGRHTLKISAAGFSSVEIRDVQIVRVAVKALPAVRLEVALIADCGTDVRPSYFRLANGRAEIGAIAGTVTSESGHEIAGATVTLYLRGKGKVATQRTNKEGGFSFTGLLIRPEEYSLSIRARRYFSDELRRLTVFSGLEAVYAPITMEACAPGRCQPHLKRLKVIGDCA